MELLNGAEFERRVLKLARRKKVICQFVADKGKRQSWSLVLRRRIHHPSGSEERNRSRPKRGESMSAFTYPAKFTAGSDGRILVEFVDLPHVATDGKDDREAMEEAMDALGSDLSIRLSRREEIPAPSAANSRQRLVPVPLWLAPKLALYLAMRDQQVNNSELARRLGVHERVIRRMLNPEHASKAEKIQAALAALGKQMIVDVRDAA
jgi:antitoxin HicB